MYAVSVVLPDPNSVNSKEIVLNNNFLVVYKIMGLATLMSLDTAPSLKTAV